VTKQRNSLTTFLPSSLFNSSMSAEVLSFIDLCCKRKREGKSGMLRVYKDPEGDWWLDIDSSSSITHHKVLKDAKVVERYASVEAMPRFIGDKVATLLCAEAGDTLEGVGRRISETNLWVYLD